MHAAFDIASDSRNPSPLFGRDAELSVLQGCFEETLGGHGNLALVSGEAGAGKTTLVNAFTARAATSGALVLHGYCYDLSVTPPYGPWLELAERWPVAPDLPRLSDLLLGESSAGDHPDRSAIFDRVRSCVQSLSESTPLVIVLEDLHWADQASLDLLRYLARHIDRHRILIVVTYRKEELNRRHPLAGLVPSLVRETNPRRIVVSALAREHIHQIVRANWPLPPDQERRLVDYLLRQSEGHPLFTIEVLRTLEQEGYLQRERSGWRLTDLSQVPVPSLVRQVIDGRMALLGEESRRFLEVAATIGHQVPLDIWQAVTGMSDEKMLAVLDQAIDLHVLEDTAGKDPIGFVHALTREALYTSILPPVRREWHREIAEALAGSASRPPPEPVAYHFQQAGDPRAVEWLLRAGVRAHGAAAWVSAAERFVDAANLLEGTDDGDRLRGWLLLYSAYILRFSQSPRIPMYLAEAQRIADATNDRVLAAYIKYHGGNSATLRGDVKRGLEDLELGVQAIAECFDQSDPPPTEELALGIIRAQLPEFRPPGGEAAAGAVAVSGRPPVVAHRGVVVNWLAHAGRYRESLSMGERLETEMAEALGDGRDRQLRGLVCTIGMAHSYAALGRLDDARREYRMGRQGFLSIGEYMVVEYSCWCDLYNVVLPYYTDRVEERERLLQEGKYAWSRATGIVSWATPVSQTELEIVFLDGRWTEAREHASVQRSAPLANTAHRAHVILGMIARCQGSPALAWEHVRELMPHGPATEPGDCYFFVHVVAQELAIQLALDAADLDTALTWLESRDHWLTWSGARRWLAETQLLWARYYRLAGDRATARERALQALEEASAPRQPLQLSVIERFIGGMDSEEQRYQDAEERLLRSLQLAESCRVPFEVGLSKLALAELYVTLDRRALARRQLDEARTIFEQLGADPARARVRELHALAGSPATGSPLGLTSRELDVLRLLVRGLTDKEIAGELFISHHTVMRHVSSILRKLDVDSRTAAVVRALRSELV